MNHLEEREAVKFILNGRSFDTASSTPAAIVRGAKDAESGIEYHYPGAAQMRFELTLFRTAKGAFFLHDHTTVKYPKGKPVVSDTAMEYTPEKAVKWIVESGAAILDGAGLQLPDEA